MKAHVRTARADHFVSYIRVSTAKQGASGLGLDAQKAAILAHVGPGRIVGEFVEIESGGKSDRPELAAALVECELRGATLVIAKLDRLSRNVAFLSALMESGVNFVACDNPHATKLMIHMLVAFAEHEREAISARTVAALAQAKLRGVRLGNPRLAPGTAESVAAARAVKSDNAIELAQRYAPKIAEARASGAETLTAIAVYLTLNSIPTPRGCAQWHAEQVRQVLRRLTPAA